jgi:hypothetical protein
MTDEPKPQHTQIFGNAEYEAAIDTILQRTTSKIRIFDQALGREYNSSRRCELLRRFLLAGRRNTLQIVVHDVGTLDRNCPRILNLLRAYGHAISINETHPSAKLVYDRFVVVDDRCFAHRFHFDEMRGLAGVDDPIGAHTFIERFSEIWEASSPAVFATTLGL